MLWKQQTSSVSAHTTCFFQVHAHPQRRSHHRAPLDIPKGYLGRGMPHTLTREKLELFAVLCIETSHYVSFIKYGPNSQDWIFFDSMADRQGEGSFFLLCLSARIICTYVLWLSCALFSGESDGFNIPEVHACPEVSMYLKMSPAELANQVPRDMEGVAKRLFCDAYMYLYQSPSMCLYRWGGSTDCCTICQLDKNIVPFAVHVISFLPDWFVIFIYV